MPHPDDPSGHWASEDSAVSGGPILNRRDRNRLSSVQARKKARIDRHQIELNLARYRIENRTLRELLQGVDQRPSFDQFLVNDLLNSLLFASSKSRTSSIRKGIVHMLTNLSLVGHGVQNALDTNCQELDEICSMAASAVLGIDAAAAQACEDARRDLERARDQFHIHGEALRLIMEQMRSTMKEEQQARVMNWAHEHADLVYNSLKEPGASDLETGKCQTELMDGKIKPNETRTEEL